MPKFKIKQGHGLNLQKIYIDKNLDYFCSKTFNNQNIFIKYSPPPHDIALLYFIIHYYIVFLSFVLLVINNKTPL